MNRWLLTGLILGIITGYWLATVRWTPTPTPTKAGAQNPRIWKLDDLPKTGTDG